MPPDESLRPEECEVESTLRMSSLPLEGKSESTSTPYKPRIIWSKVIFIATFHVVALYTFIFKFMLFRFKLLSVIWGFLVLWTGGFGVTAGVHRFWSHRAYKAKWPLKVILLICYTIAGQNTIYDWVRDHRVHHKCSETDGDPHNSKRGVFFAHVGWLMQKKHPEVLRHGVQVDMSDILEGPLLSFHTRHFTILKLLLCFILPCLVPYYCWEEDITNIILGLCFLRYVVNLHLTWLVNSAAHMYGYKPYDKRIGPTDKVPTAILVMGEGWHNYHHTFPWDYKSAELGNNKLNITTAFIDMFAKIGWAYDLKTASPSLVASVKRRHGDGTYPEHDHHH